MGIAAPSGGFQSSGERARRPALNGWGPVVAMAALLACASAAAYFLADAGLKRLIETFIFDFHEDIYRRKLTIELAARLRDEMKFKSAEELKEQMARDCEKALTMLKTLNPKF